MTDAKSDFAALRKARALLLVLLATCRETMVALEAAGNVLDAELESDLGKMIARSEAELETLTAKIKSLSAE